MIRKFLNFLAFYWLPITAVVLASITILSLAPLQELPPAPGSDKLHHLIAYAALVTPLALRKPKHWWLIVCFFLAFSGVVELVQPYVNRYGEWLDMAANSLGLLCGLLIAELVSFIYPEKSKQKRQV